MNNKYSKENVRIGDRVLVSGCGEELSAQYWGTVLAHHPEGNGIQVLMDNIALTCATHYKTEVGEDCYYAWWSDIKDIKYPDAPDYLGWLQKPETQPTNPLQKVIEDLTATHRYLEQVTGKKYVAQLKGFDLESENGYDSNMVTVQFVVEEK